MINALPAPSKRSSLSPAPVQQVGASAAACRRPPLDDVNAYATIQYVATAAAGDEVVASAAWMRSLRPAVSRRRGPDDVAAAATLDVTA
jgi:hypothetical protein